MDLPAKNETGYRDSSPVHKAANLKAKLLLVHNYGDDNVLFQNVFMMSNALQLANRPFEMMVYPQKAHGVGGIARKHLLETTTSFFERQLK
jgi:dipeptidyl-peptidase-4